jgi:type I restriction enzyme S subunit
MSNLPQGWTKSAIGDLIELNPKNSCDDDSQVGFVPMPLLGKSYLGQVAFESRQWRDVKTGYTHFADGDVLLAKITPCFENGKAGIAKNLPSGIGAGSTEYFVCRAFPEVLHPKYLLAFFKTENFVNFGATQMTGSVGHRRVPKSYVTDTLIPLAPLPEQKRIADKLDTVLARVDACRERLNRVPLILKRFRQSVLAAAISGKLTEDWKQRKNEWTYSKAEELCEWITKGTTPPKSGMYEGSGDIPYIKVYNLRFDGRLDFTVNPTFVDKDTHEIMLKRSKVFPGDILMNIVGPPLGKVSIVPDSFSEWNINQAIAVFRAKREIYNRFLAYFLMCEATIADLIGKSKATAGQFNLTLEICRQIDVPVPSMDEQHEIVRRVETLFAFADRLEARLVGARAAADRLSPALLAKAFRGELVPQDPNDEPAAELLKRLAAARTATSDKPRRGRAAKAEKRPSGHPSQVCDS